MKRFIEKTMNNAKRYTLFDYTVLKITLVSAGILLGTYFSEYFSSNILAIWMLFIITYIIMLYRTFFQK